MVKYDYAEDHIIVNSFQPQYVAELMDAGFLPMLYEMRKADIPMGCWDSPRAALWLCHPQEYHARAITTGLRSPDPISTPIDTLFQLSPRKWRKLLGGHKYFLTVNVAFNHTLAMAAAYHATRRATWIAGDLEMTMRALTLATSAPSITQAHSIELWVQHADGEPVVLAAGEIGSVHGRDMTMNMNMMQDRALRETAIVCVIQRFPANYRSQAWCPFCVCYKSVHGPLLWTHPVL